MDPMAAQMNVSMACMMNSVGMYMEGCAVNDICRGLLQYKIEYITARTIYIELSIIAYS